MSLQAAHTSSQVKAARFFFYLSISESVHSQSQEYHGKSDLGPALAGKLRAATQKGK